MSPSLERQRIIQMDESRMIMRAPIVGFQHEHEARAFLDELKERMRKFELALHPDKTRLIRFVRDAAKQREKLGEGKPETFEFLGFTHFCTRSRKMGHVRHRAQDDQEAYASEAAGHQDRVAQDNARPYRENRRLDQTDAARASELLRSLPR